MTLLFVVLVVRIYVVQVAHAEFWLAKAKETWSASETIPAVRGKITDRDGNVLAMDVAGYTVAVSPEVLNRLGLVDEVVDKLHELLGKPKDQLYDIATKRNAEGKFYRQREVRNEGWKIDKELADRIAAFREELRNRIGEKEVGIYLLEEQKRYYPRNSLAAHLIGYVNKAGEAMNGVELSLDELLRGKDGRIKYERDGNRVQIRNGHVEIDPVVHGKNVQLTIDSDIQYYLEKAIKEAYDKYEPKSITAIAADPKTMKILGMASLPSYNPNVYWETEPGADFDYAIKGLYEPGSTFKIVTLAAAVEEGVFDPDETYMSGSITVAGRPIRDHRREGWGEITMLEGLKKSSNVAFVKLGYEKMDTSTLKKYIDAFGFGQPTGVPLKGEVSGMVAPRYATEWATLTFGQGRVQVTPIQQVTAVAAIANGGILMQPQLVEAVEDPNNGTVQRVEPKAVRRVISGETARKVGEYLEQVVADGTGQNAYIEGYRVAGKTGTAQKVVNGQYAEGKYIVSFIGYAPVEDPKIVVYVVVDEPNDPYAGGGSVAAPVFKDIMLQSLRHLGIGPSNAVKALNTGASKEKVVTVPEVTELTISQAREELRARSINLEVVGGGATVLQQIPKPGATMSPTQRVYLITEERSKLQVPDLTGLPLRDALEICSLLEMRCFVEGEGFVASQSLSEEAGGRVLRLALEPPGRPAVPPDGAAAGTEEGDSSGKSGEQENSEDSDERQDGAAEDNGSGGG
jgi:penicillin-binding protein 2B